MPAKTKKKTRAPQCHRLSRAKWTPLKIYARLGLRKSIQAKLIGVSERTLGTVTKPSLQMARRLSEGARLLNALAEVMDADFIAEWLVTPNDAFDGLKPLEVTDRGEVDRIWQVVYRLRSGELT